MYKNGGILATALIIVASSALGSSGPIPVGLSNGIDYVNFTGSNGVYPFQNLIGPFSAGYGGAFSPTISAVDSSGNPVGQAYLTTVWCVDYQLNVSSQSLYDAEVTTLNNIGPSANNNVRYGNLTGTAPGSNPGWLNALTDPSGIDGGNSNSAAYRYTLAAALISVFTDSTDTANPTQVDGNSGNGPADVVAKNQAIQEAIWYITANNDYPGLTDAPFNLAPPASSCAAGNVTTPLGASDANSANYLCWVSYAENNAAGVATNKWAVISGPASVSSGLLDPSNNSFQTLLVQTQVTPEPGFYVTLGLGMAGMFFAVRKRRKA